MTILQVAQKVALRVIGARVDSAFTPSRNRDTVAEIIDLANDVAVDIARSYDWRGLTKMHTITGDGVADAFPFPSDYDRMLKASSIDEPGRWFWNYSPIASVNEWMMLKSSGILVGFPGAWIILGDAFHFTPTPVLGQDAWFPYISTEIVRGVSGTPKESFTADSDTFVLDERILTLGTIWRWKEQKGLEYAEDMQNYELALSQEQTRDKGARTYAVGRRDFPGVRTAYPGKLGF